MPNSTPIQPKVATTAVHKERITGRTRKSLDSLNRICPRLACRRGKGPSQDVRRAFPQVILVSDQSTE